MNELRTGIEFIVEEKERDGVYLVQQASYGHGEKRELVFAYATTNGRAYKTKKTQDEEILKQRVIDALNEIWQRNPNSMIESLSSEPNKANILNWYISQLEIYLANPLLAMQNQLSDDIIKPIAEMVAKREQDYDSGCRIYNEKLVRLAETRARIEIIKSINENKITRLLRKISNPKAKGGGESPEPGYVRGITPEDDAKSPDLFFSGAPAGFGLTDLEGKPYPGNDYF
ncbi:TPA: hypothetical protein HA246_00825 [Candidatus Woesearchaeota archaeon]|nr:hypothetical protein [Candidatus Woesearchaeota archaeon]